MIKTFTGKNVDVFNFAIEDYDIADVAHSLARVCRYNGHTAYFYSVAQHSINALRIASLMKANAPTCLYALIHDATECYIGDLPGPVKARMPEFRKVEDDIAGTILDHYGELFAHPNWTDYIDFSLVKKIDASLLIPEMSAMFKETVIELDIGPILTIPSAKVILTAGVMVDDENHFKAFHTEFSNKTKIFLDEQIKTPITEI